MEMEYAEEDEEDVEEEEKTDEGRMMWRRRM